MIDGVKKIEAAFKRIASHIVETRLEQSLYLSNLVGGSVYLKLENFQKTGSFKSRGALNKLLLLKTETPNSLVLTASTGNHALGISYALHITGIRGKIYLPFTTSPSKIQALKDTGNPIELYGIDSVATEIYVRKMAQKGEGVYVSPYNDETVITGQGTLGIELIKQLPELEYVFVSVGGGGLIAGIATYLKALKPSVKIIGCQPQHASSMYACIKAGKIIPIPERETISDGTAGGIEENAITFPIVQQLVDDFILVSESEIIHAMRMIYKAHNFIIEGAAGVAVAGLMQYQKHLKHKKAVVIICGGNVSAFVAEHVKANETNEDSIC